MLCAQTSRFIARLFLCSLRLTILIKGFFGCFSRRFRDAALVLLLRLLLFGSALPICFGYLDLVVEFGRLAVGIIDLLLETFEFRLGIDGWGRRRVGRPLTRRGDRRLTGVRSVAFRCASTGHPLRGRIAGYRRLVGHGRARRTVGRRA